MAHSASTSISPSSSSSLSHPQQQLAPLHAALLDQLTTERAIYDGAASFLAVFPSSSSSPSGAGAAAEDRGQDQLKHQVELELQGARERILELEGRLNALERGTTSPSPSSNGHATDSAQDQINSPTSYYAPSDYYRSEGTSPQQSPIPQPPSFPDDLPPTFDASAELDADPEVSSFSLLLASTLSLFAQLEHLINPNANPNPSTEIVDVLEVLRTTDSIVANLVSEVRLKYELSLSSLLPSITPLLADSPLPSFTHLRTAAYRLLRHLVIDQADIFALQGAYIDLFLVRTLARDHSSTLPERSQALRLIRLLLSLPGSPSLSQSGDGGEEEGGWRPVPCSVIRAVVAIAEAGQEEKLRLAGLEMLGELLITDLPLLSLSLGLRVLLSVLAEGPHDLSPLLAAAFVGQLDTPRGRRWFRVGTDVEVVLAAFTEVQGKPSSSSGGGGGGGSHSHAQEEKVRASAKIVTGLLKSWAGVMYLNLNDKRALRSLVDSLTNPSGMIRDTLLDMFVNIFNVKTPAWYASAGQAGSRLSGSNRRSAALDPSASGSIDAVPAHEKTNLVDQYLSILLMIFIDAGLVEALVSVAADCRDPDTARKVSLLMGEILQLANRVLPLSHAAKIQTLPRLFAMTTAFDTSQGRLAASSTLAAVDTLNRNQGRGARPGDVGQGEDARARSNSLEDPLKRGQRQVESTKLLVGLSIDDAHFRNLLLETQVLSTKDHTKWNVEIMLELLEGPLLNPKRLDEAMRASKFMRRLCGFFQPFAYRYSEVRKSRHTAKFTQLGCALFTTLLSSPDGVRYLAEDKLLRQIADCLNQLDPLASPPASEIVLSKHRMESTLASGYFEMLGTLTKSVEGVRLLDQFKVFTSFYRISDLRSREDLVKAIIEHVDYTMDGHPRVFLSKALTSSYKHVRVFATQHLSQLLSAPSSAPGSAQEWQIRLLLTQIYDPSPEVCELAVKVLEKACASLETLEIVVQMRPSLDHLGEMGTGLLTRFLSTSIGVRYLHEIGFIQRELDEWYDERNAIYVVQLELQLASALHTDQISSDSTKSPFDGTPPAHFYGELVKTEEGCEMLEDSAHFPEFADFIRQNAMEEMDSDIIAKLKSVLWAVGQVGASVGGLDFIDREFILESIVDIAEESPIYSLRGTAYFVLGLISSTLEGVEMLEEFGWEGVLTPLGNATGLCVPMELASFVYTPPWEPPAPPMPEALLLASPQNYLEVEALSALANLSNHILATKASKTLARLKQRHRELFSSPRLYYRALEMLANHHYRLAVRRYIIELFDLPLDDEVAERIMEAGDELRVEGEKEREDAGDDEEFGWRKRGGAALEKAVKVILDGVDGDFTDDDEISSVEDEGAVIPLQVLRPGLSIRGFLMTG